MFNQLAAAIAAMVCAAVASGGTMHAPGALGDDAPAIDGAIAGGEGRAGASFEAPAPGPGAPLVGPSIPGDINGDGVVDLGDMILLLSFWETNDPAADLNGDGSVDALDLAILLSYWGATAIPGDLNGDWRVDAADLAILLSFWGEAGGAPDINEDGSVDALDLAILLSYWTAPAALGDR